MPYEIQVRRLVRTPVITIRVEAPAQAIGPTMAEAFGALFAYAESRGVHPIGVFGRYHSTSGENVVMDAGVPLPQPLPGEGRIEAGELPEGDAAVTLHVGPYDAIEPAYDAIRAWIEAHGRRASGVPWESYLTDPETVPDPAEWRTEVVWPIA